MMSYSFTEGESLLEGSLLGESFYFGEPDMVLFDGNVDMTTTYNDLAPANFVNFSSKSQSRLGVQSDNVWLSAENAPDALEKIVNNEFDLSCWSHSHGSTLLPSSPTNSYDSGVSSPGTDLSYVLSDASPSLSNTESIECGDILHIPVQKPLVFEADATNYFDFPVHTADIDMPLLVIDQLNFDFTDNSCQPATVPIGVRETNDVSLEATSKLDFADVESTINASADETSTITDQYGNLTSAVLLPQSIPTASPKSRCGRKSKISNVEERKKRKRDQNKTAATRYRERKRCEAQEREAEYNVLDKRHKELNDKASQISKEINYLKELMIEVYKIKGIIT